MEWKIDIDETAEKAEDEISALHSQFLDDEELLEIYLEKSKYQHQISKK